MGEELNKDPVFQRRFKRATTVWLWVGIIILVAVVAWLLGHVSQALEVLLGGCILAFIYAPCVNMLERRFRIPRLAGSLIAMLLFLVCLVGFTALIVTPVFDQLSALAGNLPTYIDGLQSGWSKLVDRYNFVDDATEGMVSQALSDVGSTLTSLVTSFVRTTGGGLASFVGRGVSLVVSAVMALVLSFWLAKDYRRINKELSVIAGPRFEEDYRVATTVMATSMGGYIKGLLITSTCTGLIAWIGFTILGVPYAGLLGFVTAVLNIIPYVGPWVGGALAFLSGATVGWVPAFGSILVSVIAQQLTDMLVSPKVMQASVSLHPVLVILALLGGGAIGGIAGMVLAVPVTAAAKGLFVHYFQVRTGRELATANGALFKGAYSEIEDRTVTEKATDWVKAHLEVDDPVAKPPAKH